jgi:hypothetical protein
MPLAAREPPDACANKYTALELRPYSRHRLLVHHLKLNDLSFLVCCEMNINRTGPIVGCRTANLHKLRSMDEVRDNPGVIAPPPLIALATLVLGLALDWFLPSFVLRSIFGLWARLIVGAILMGAGEARGFWGDLASGGYLCLPILHERKNF